MIAYPTTGTAQVPVVVLSGYLGAGKTTLLNHLLRAPGARVGVVVNDFGAIGVDAALVRGQVDEPASISGGCLCCLPDAGGLDDALERLTHPRLRLDVVVVEASGVADPVMLRRLVRFSGVDRVRPGGVVEVVDAPAFRGLIANEQLRGERFTAASLVVVNKIDRLPSAERHALVAQVRAVLDAHGSRPPVVATSRGQVDPVLVFDVASSYAPEDELPLGSLMPPPVPATHEHACAVTVAAHGAVDAGTLVDLLEDPPARVYRLKGMVTVDTGRTRRHYVVNVVGRHVHVGVPSLRDGAPEGLVAIGMHLDEERVRERLEATLRASRVRSGGEGLRRLVRHRRLSA